MLIVILNKVNIVLTRTEILRMLVGLGEVNDLDLIRSDAVLAESCLDSEKAIVRAMAGLIQGLFEDFDYAMSPEFLQMIDGKSPQVRAMHRKLIGKEKQIEARKRLGESITMLLEEDDAYGLVAETYRDRLDHLKELAASIADRP